MQTGTATVPATTLTPAKPLNVVEFARQLGLDPATATFEQLSEAQARLAPKNPISEFTTPEDLKKFESLLDENREYVRAGSKDETLHRVLHVFPMFTGGSSEDVVVVRGEGENATMGIAAKYRVVVERFSKDIKDRKVVREVLGSFNMDAGKFLKEFKQV